MKLLTVSIYLLWALGDPAPTHLKNHGWVNPALSPSLQEKGSGSPQSWQAWKKFPAFCFIWVSIATGCSTGPKSIFVASNSFLRDVKWTRSRFHSFEDPKCACFITYENIILFPLTTRLQSVLTLGLPSLALQPLCVLLALLTTLFPQLSLNLLFSTLVVMETCWKSLVWAVVQRCLSPQHLQAPAKAWAVFSSWLQETHSGTFCMNQTTGGCWYYWCSWAKSQVDCWTSCWRMNSLGTKSPVW